jgi:hypothetical protein
VGGVAVFVALELGSRDLRQVDLEDVRHPEEVDETSASVLDVLGPWPVHHASFLVRG